MITAEARYLEAKAYYQQQQKLADIAAKDMKQAEAQFLEAEGKTQTKGKFIGLNTKQKELKNNTRLTFTNTHTGYTVTTTMYPNTYNERQVDEIVNGKRRRVFADTRMSMNKLKEYVMSK